MMSQGVTSRTVVVTNPQGLHLRPAGLLARRAAEFQAVVEIVRGQERVDGKSVLSIISLAVEQGTSITIEATGQDAPAAVEALAQLLEQEFAFEDEASGA